MVADTKLYNVLGVSPTCTEAELKRAYHKKALRLHPDKAPDKADEFKEVSHAYEILSDPEKRKLYDQFGEDGPKHGGMGGMGGGASGGARGASMGGMDPEELFSKVFGGGFGGASFGGASFGAGGGGGASPFGASFGGGSPFGGMGGGSPFGGGGMGAGRGGPPGGFAMDTDSDDGGHQKPPPIIRPFPVSLEDLYKGATKKLKITKKRRVGGEEANTLEINVKPGWKAGTKIRFNGAGNETAHGSQDMVFVVEEKPHETFKRDGDDLIVEVKVPLADALSGPTPPATFTRTLTTLDGRSLKYDLPYPSTRLGGAPLKPGQTIKISGEGMPISRAGAAKKKGDLLIKVNVTFPDRVTPQQAEAVKRLFS